MVLDLPRFALGVLLFVMVVTVALEAFDRTEPLRTGVAERQLSQQIMIEEAEFSAYDHTNVAGYQVITAVRKYQHKESFFVYVAQTGPTLNFGVRSSGGSNVCPTLNFATGELDVLTPSSCLAVLQDLNDETSVYYTHPQDRFRSTVLRDGNGTVSGILFRKI